MDKILIKVKGCSLHYNGKKYIPGNEVEIEKKYFRDDYMEKVEVEKVDKDSTLKDEKNVNTPEEQTLPMKELRVMAKALGIEIKAKTKDLFMEELKATFIENNLNLDEEIEKFTNEKNEDI
ncbi:hypothetical protein [uncultured Cetobacterium sp.]|uniref:hypothetical protein n=1 Tax=uncultured Cetobacterium sp. TaxID=527638 RepID=UPI002635FEDF|nr:hypothetical protein [uncultured Cetobacterium sp.]